MKYTSLYETKDYYSFINRGLETYLRQVGLKIEFETNFPGVFLNSGGKSLLSIFLKEKKFYNAFH